MSPCVSQSLRSDARCCDAGSGLVSLCLPVSARCCDAGSGVSPSLDAVTLAPGSCLTACLPSLAVRLPDARSCDAGCGVVSPACLPVSSWLRGRVSRLSPSLCGQMPAVTLAPGRVSGLSPCVSQSLRSDARCCDAGSGWCLPLVSLCLPVSAVGVVSCLPSLAVRLPDARSCDAGSGVVSPACLPVSPWLRGRVSRLSPSLCGQMPAVTLAPSCLRLVSLFLPVSAVRCQML